MSLRPTSGRGYQACPSATPFTEVLVTKRHAAPSAKNSIAWNTQDTSKVEDPL